MVSQTPRRLVGRRVVVTGGGSGIRAAAAGWIHEASLEDGDAILRVHLTGIFLAEKHCLGHLREAGEGATTLSGERLHRSRFSTPLPRAADPAEVGAFLLSDDASFVTPSVVMFDGGYTAL